MKNRFEQDLAQSGAADSETPASVRDPDVHEAVVDLLEGICERLSHDDVPPSLPSLPVSLPSSPGREDWEDDRPTPALFTGSGSEGPEPRWAIPPPSPESDSGRVTDPEILSQALVYADAPPAEPAAPKESPGISLDPRISVTSLLDEIEVDSLLDDAPLSLRPTSRTSFPEPERKSRLWLGAAALVVLVSASLWWLSARLDGSEPDALQPAHAALARQGVVARSTMSGIRLFVDGRDRGMLPAAVYDLASGKHELRFEAPKHKPLVRKLTVASGSVVDLGEIALEPAAERIRIELTPHNAYLQLLHVDSGETQRYAGPWPRVLSLAPGRYDVLAFRGGFRTWAMRLKVEPGGDLITWRIELPNDDIYAD